MRTRWFQNIGLGKNTSPSALPAPAAENPEGMSSGVATSIVRSATPRVRAVSTVAPAVGQGVRRARQRRDARNSGESLFQELHPLAAEANGKAAVAGDVAAGMPEARGETGRYRI